MAIQVALRNKAKESATILPANPKYFTLSKNFRESDMQLTGSSPKILVKLVNSGLLPEDARIATRKYLEKTIKRQNDFLSGFFVDCELNLVTNPNKDYEINPISAKVLANDLEKVGINLKNAKLIPYNILTYEINEESPDGLVFKLSEEGKDTAKKLISNTDDFKWDCLPDNSGLFRACLGGGGDWDAGYVNLAFSVACGRVVVVTGGASSQKFLNDYASKFKKDRDKAIKDINKKYAEMKASLRIE